MSAHVSNLDAFAAKALDLLVGVGIKDQGPVTTGEAALNRQRAFTLFHLAYAEARRAVSYLRPNDGDVIAPSLYAGREVARARKVTRAKRRAPVRWPRRAERIRALP